MTAIQDEKNSKPNQDQQPQMENRATLMKVSQDVHQPEGTLDIPKELILFWQDLQANSNVAQTLMSEGSR